MKPIQTLYAVLSIVLTGESIAEFISNLSGLIVAVLILGICGPLIYSLRRANSKGTNH